MIGEVMADAGADLRDVDLFAATTGPGAFTGIRIGLATLRGLALAAGRPMLGMTSLEAIAHMAGPSVRRDESVLAAIESKREELFIQLFGRSSSAQTEPAALRPDDLGGWLAAHHARLPLLVAGDGAARALFHLRAQGFDAEAATGTDCLDAATVAALAARRTAMASRSAPQPLYLRAPAVTFPKRDAP